MTPHLPADISDPVKKRAILLLILENTNAKLAEMQDRKELLKHELAMLGESIPDRGH